MPTILVVDDDDITCDLLRRIIESMGNAVEIAYEGQTAIKTAENVQPNLIIMDLLLPNNINGWEVADAIRGIPGLQDVPIIAITAASDLVSPIDVFDEFIRKPFGVKMMEDLINKHLKD